MGVISGWGQSSLNLHIIAVHVFLGIAGQICICMYQVQLTTSAREMDAEATVCSSTRKPIYDNPIDKQRETALSIICGKDTFVSLPNGYRKAVIFALLPVAFDKHKGKS